MPHTVYSRIIHSAWRGGGGGGGGTNITEEKLIQLCTRLHILQINGQTVTHTKFFLPIFSSTILLNETFFKLNYNGTASLADKVTTSLVVSKVCMSSYYRAQGVQG